MKYGLQIMPGVKKPLRKFSHLKKPLLPNSTIVLTKKEQPQTSSIFRIRTLKKKTYVHRFAVLH